MTTTNGFSEQDFETLSGMEDGSTTGDDVDELWGRARGLLSDLGEALFGEGSAHADLWPEGAGDDGDRLPFLWGRLKRAGNERYATHIGIFISPSLCNLGIDLEKDLVDAGESAEKLEDFVDFFADEMASVLDPGARSDLRVWTDTDNVVAARDFGSIDFGAFMAANRDAAHPWPKIGYLIDADDVQGFADRWLDEYQGRGQPLVAVYDAMIRRFNA